MSPTASELTNSVNNRSDARESVVGTFLTGLTVFEVGDGIASGVATHTLGQLGATVVKMRAAVDPSNLSDLPRSRRHAMAVLDDGKQILPASGPLAAIERLRPDIVYVDCTSSFTTSPIEVSEAAELARSGAAPSWVTITPFGLTGPYRDYRGSNLIGLAAGGLLASCQAGNRPAPLAGHLALGATGLVSALAGLHGLDTSLVSDCPIHVDVSMQEAVAAAGSLQELGHALMNCPGLAASSRYSAPSGVFPCLDGSIRLTVIDDHQWRALCAAMGDPAWAAEIHTLSHRGEQKELIDHEVSRWTALQQKEPCVGDLQTRGVPATVENSIADLVTSTQVGARSFLRPVVVDGSIGQTPRIPVQPTSWDPPDRPSRPEHHLRDLGVVELTHYIAGPVAGSILGAMGASVVRVEDPTRPCLYRREGPFADGRPGLERGAYYAIANTCKRSLSADPASGEGQRQIKQLLRSADVVIENVGTRRARALGVDVQPSSTPDELIARISVFGRTGPMADYRGYATNVHGYSGLIAASAEVAGQPFRLASALGDLLTSYTAALLISAWWIGPQASRRGILDIAMYEVLAYQLAELISAQTSGQADPGIQDEDELNAVFATADHRWIAVTIQLGREIELIQAVLQFAEHGGVDGRVGSHAPSLPAEALDELARAFRMQSATWWTEQLQGLGVPAFPVLTAGDLINDRHLAGRGFFQEILHDELGRRRVVGLPWCFADRARPPVSGPPILGDFEDRTSGAGARPPDSPRSARVPESPLQRTRNKT